MKTSFALCRTLSLIWMGVFLCVTILLIFPKLAETQNIQPDPQAEVALRSGLKAASLEQWQIALKAFQRAVTLQQQISADPGLIYWQKMASSFASKPALTGLPNFIDSIKTGSLDAVSSQLAQAVSDISQSLQTLHIERLQVQDRRQRTLRHSIHSIPPEILFDLALAYDRIGGKESIASVWYLAYLHVDPAPQEETKVITRITRLEFMLQKKATLLKRKTVKISELARSTKIRISNLLHGPGSSFQDNLASGGLGPEMVIVPAGSYNMGNIHGENSSNPSMVHVDIPKAFAIGKYEVTVQEYRRFAEATGRTVRGNQTSLRHPIFGLFWEDATAYCKWLSHETGESYRLPSEAEWEYAARAGTDTKFWWGNHGDHEYANYGIGHAGFFPFPFGVVKGRDRWQFTSPVGSFPANPFGLYDTSGNVWEIVADCYRFRYTKKVFPEAKPYVKKHCKGYTMRGGSWGYDEKLMSSASRAKISWEVKTFLGIGFRVAKDIE